jgi:hypothetical protein
MARPRYTAQLTFRLAPSLREDLEREARAKGDDLGELVRDVLAAHVWRQSDEGNPPGRAGSLPRSYRDLR